MTRMAELQSAYRRKTQSARADLYIRPLVEEVDALDWTLFEDLIERGYRTALPQLEAWLSEQSTSDV